VIEVGGFILRDAAPIPVGQIAQHWIDRDQKTGIDHRTEMTVEVR
jgi:hypothetical protein